MSRSVRFENRAMRRNKTGRLSVSAKVAGIVGGVAAVAVGGGLLTLAAPSAGATGTILTVDTLDDGDARSSDCAPPVANSCSLRDALLAAEDGDVIVFDEGLAGTITFDSNEGSLFFDSGSLDIVGPGSSALTIDAGGNSRVFYVYGSNSSSNVSISGLTITGGNDTGYGGGINFYGRDDHLTLTDVVITGNSSGSGGGLHVKNVGSLRIEDSTLSNNYSSAGGGALYALYANSSVEIVNSTFVNNTADHGGAIRSKGDGTLVIDDSVFDSNSATRGWGGALYLYNNGDTTITNTTFSNNYASEGGGALDFDYGGNAVTATITGCTFDGNSAGGGGGAITSSSSTDLTLIVSNSPFTANTSGGGGSALAIALSTDLTVNQSTIVGNSTVGNDAEGGAIFQYFYENAVDTGSVTISGSIISGNTAADPDAPADFALYNGTTATFDVNSSMFGVVDTNITINGSGNIISIDPAVGVLADNGGPTKTMALLEGAAAIDAGPNPVATFNGNGFDQRGTPFVRVNNGRVDIGAFEVQPDPDPEPEPTSTTTSPAPTDAGEVVPAFTG